MRPPPSEDRFESIHGRFDPHITQDHIRLHLNNGGFSFFFFFLCVYEPPWLLYRSNSTDCSTWRTLARLVANASIPFCGLSLRLVCWSGEEWGGVPNWMNGCWMKWFAVCFGDTSVFVFFCRMRVRKVRLPWYWWVRSQQVLSNVFVTSLTVASTLL